jgi:hypothetical protein
MPPITEDNGRARRELGFRPTPFAQGLAAAFAWYQAQGDRPPPDFSWEDHVFGLLGV